MEIRKIKIDPEKGRVILNKGKREPGGHIFEIYLNKGVYYALIQHAFLPMKEKFEINPKKYKMLEDAVDARIEELRW